jgi:hypothetical protein
MAGRIEEPSVNDDDVISLQGPVERIEGKLVLRVPLDAGGSELIACSRGISEVEGDYLKITIPEWLSGMLRIDAGSLVSVDNRDGKCNIHPVDPLPLQ